MTEIHKPDRGPHAPFSAAPGVQVVPLRTPTLPPATHTNCVLLGYGEVIVVDPASVFPDEQDRLLQFIREQGATVRAIWLTHHHPDHVGGVNALRSALDVPVHAHQATADRLEGSVPVDETLLHGDEAELLRPDGSPLRIEALHTPGHARGHMAFRDIDERLVVAGDLVAGQGTIVIDPPEGDMADYLATLARLIEEGVSSIVPSHGPAIEHGEAKLLEYIQHRHKREEQVVEVLAGWPDRTALALEIVPVVYPEVPAIFHPLAARQVLAHLLKLEAEGLVDRPDGSTGVPGAPVYMSMGFGAANATPDATFRWRG